MLNVLVIGGSGFLSGTIVGHAQARGHQVWALTRGRRPLPAGVRSLVADRGNHAAFAQALAGAQTHWDLAVDCIGFTPADIQQDITVLTPLAQHLVVNNHDIVRSFWARV
jgi:nucleoside-diphosphate-sugar epimerase